MNLLDIFFKTKTKNPLELEKKYLTVKNNDNIYGFQKKFYKQSQILLNSFGNINKNLPNKIKLIIITDTHNLKKRYIIFR